MRILQLNGWMPSFSKREEPIRSQIGLSGLARRAASRASLGGAKAVRTGGSKSEGSVKGF
eukprot:7362207-Pyramimonas_sp.AAC.1